jgi:hypothetical protein
LFDDFGLVREEPWQIPAAIANKKFDETAYCRFFGLRNLPVTGHFKRHSNEQ